MTQATNLIQKYDPNAVFSFLVGAVDIVAYRLYYRDATDLLVVAGDNENRILVVPMSAEKAGKPVSGALVGAGTFILTASGSITKDALVSPAADGKVRAATVGDVVIGRAYWGAGNGELVSIVTDADVASASATITGTHGESMAVGSISEEITLATDSATTIGAEDLFPANADILGCVARCTEAVNNRTALIIGLTAGDLDGLVVSGGLALTLNATAVGTGALINTHNVAAATATITTSGGSQNTTGKVRVTTFYRQFVAPTS